jgi:hypothetical protein
MITWAPRPMNQSRRSQRKRTGDDHGDHGAGGGPEPAVRARITWRVTAVTAGTDSEVTVTITAPRWAHAHRADVTSETGHGGHGDGHDATASPCPRCERDERGESRRHGRHGGHGGGHDATVSPCPPCERDGRDETRRSRPARRSWRSRPANAAVTGDTAPMSTVRAARAVPAPGGARTPHSDQ